MLQQIKSLLAIIALCFIGAAQSFAVDFLTPKIKNYGSYKPISYSAGAVLRPLFGHVPASVIDAEKLHPMDANRVLHLSVVLPLVNESELDELILDQVNPNSPRFKQHLSHDEFVARFAPSREDVDTVIEHLEGHGMQVFSVEPNRLIIHVRANIKAINQVFNTEMYHFADRAGRRFYAPAYELQIDNTIPILGVQGLENHIKARSYHKIFLSCPSLQKAYQHL